MLGTRFQSAFLFMLINTKLQVPSGVTDLFVPTGCPAEGGAVVDQQKSYAPPSSLTMLYIVYNP